MSLSDNLRLIRKDRGITQEQLAEMLKVSRQSVSKWELGEGYPETEKLITLSQKLNVSLDYLISEQSNTKETETVDKSVAYVTTGKITIAAYDQSEIVSCLAVKSAKVFGNGKAPKYLLTGVTGFNFWGEKTVILGWYKTTDEVKKEIAGINDAICRGENCYELKYFAKVELKGIFGQPHIVE